MEDQLHLPGSGDINFAFAYTSTLPPQTALAPPFPVTETHKNSSYHMGSDTIKARIMSHPLYPALLRAFIDCRKVRAYANTTTVLSCCLMMFLLCFASISSPNYHGSMLKICCLRSELRRKLLVGSLLSPTSLSQIQMTRRKRNSQQTQTSTSSW
jgi:hypothetical protein